MEELNSATVAEISTFLDEASHDPQTSQIPTGIVITGPSGSYFSITQQLSRRKRHGNGARIFVPLSSGNGSNLKAMVKALIQRATSNQSGIDDEADEVQPSHRKAAKLLDYDLQLLHDHVREQHIQQVVLAFEDTEAFDGELLSALIELLGCWHDRIPFVLLFSIATSVDSLQQRLSKAAIKCLNGRLFNVAPSSEVLEQVFEAVIGNKAGLFIGSNLVSTILERQSDYIQSIKSFVDAVKYAYMSCYYGNALSIFLNPGLSFEDVPSDHFEALRALDSFRVWARQLLDNKGVSQLRTVLEEDEQLFRLVQQEIAEGQAALGDTTFALTVVRALQQSLPNTAVSARSSLYVQAKSGKLAGSALIRTLLLTIRKVPSDVAVGVLKDVLALDIEKYNLASCADIATQLDDLIRAQEEDTQPLRSADDLKNSTLRTTVVAQKVELSKQKSTLSKQDTAYTSIMRQFTDILEKFFTGTLVNPKDLLFHEIFVYDLKSPHREVFTPRPRHAIERALASPHDYLACDCCVPEQGERGEATLAATQPATAVLYQLYLESGSLINASDLWHAFQAVMGDGREEEQTMALFQRALAELRALGMMKRTRKRVDHIAKVAWRGL